MQKFVDVSNNNGPHVDFEAIKKAGAVGVYLKVTEGISYNDPYYAANYARAKAAGLKVGGYHFGHPGNSAAQELGHFLSHLKLEPGDLKPALDLEVTDGVSSAHVNAYATIFLNTLKGKIGEPAVLYSGASFMHTHALDTRPERKWVASYGAAPQIHWDAWQFTDGQTKYPGAILHLDTSKTPSIWLFAHKAPIHKKIPAAAKAKLARYRRELTALYRKHPHWYGRISRLNLKISRIRKQINL